VTTVAARTKYREPVAVIKKNGDTWQIVCPLCGQLVGRTDNGADFSKAEKSLNFLIANHVRNEHRTMVLLQWRAEK